MRRTLALCFVLLASCGGSTGSLDAGSLDAGARESGATDAATTPSDAGVAADAAASLDAGPAPDAATPAIDAGLSDGGPAIDAGLSDGGPAIDAASPGDAGMPPDGGLDASMGDAGPGSYPYCACGSDRDTCLASGCGVALSPCTTVADCPVPATGDAVVSCTPWFAGSVCVLGCPSGTTCPDGMACFGGSSTGSAPVCAWPRTPGTTCPCI
ncbi:MAG: hypothetical protein R3B82_15855 [Sandaracinaceae bacterium]